LRFFYFTENSSFFKIDSIDNKALNAIYRTYAKQTLTLLYSLVVLDKGENCIDRKTKWSKVGCAVRTEADYVCGAHGAPYAMKL
jgi:hypothetical protein